MDYKLCWSSVMFFLHKFGKYMRHVLYYTVFVLIMCQFCILSESCHLFIFTFLFGNFKHGYNMFSYHFTPSHSTPFIFPYHFSLPSSYVFLQKFTGLTYWCYYIQSVEGFSEPLSICILEEKCLVPFKQPSTSNSSLIRCDTSQ